MKYICDKCKKESEEYGGYCVTENKDLCPKCWEKYIEIKNRHHQELTKWWENKNDTPQNVEKPKVLYQQPQKFAGGACPECGATLWFQEGCAKCISCGYSKC